MAPAGTPQPIIKKLEAANRAALENPEVRQALAAQGFSPLLGTAEDFDKLYRTERDKWAKVHQGNRHGQGLRSNGLHLMSTRPSFMERRPGNWPAKEI